MRQKSYVTIAINRKVEVFGDSNVRSRADLCTTTTADAGADSCNGNEAAYNLYFLSNNFSLLPFKTHVYIYT